MAKDHQVTKQLPASTQRLRAYITSLVIIKDLVLFCLAIPGLVALVRPSFICQHDTRIVYNQTRALVPEILGVCNCGNSVAEAISMGCRYDSLAAAWLPSHCIDEELTAEFERSGDGLNGRWRYWVDWNHTEEITLDELQEKGDDTKFRFYSTTEWHVVHCIFYWRKQIRARHTGVTVEPRYNSEEHTHHCGALFMMHEDPGVVAGVVLKSDAL